MILRIITWLSAITKIPAIVEFFKKLKAKFTA